MELAPPGGFLMPPRTSRALGLSSEKMSWPVISLSFAWLRWWCWGLALGALLASLKISCPESSALFSPESLWVTLSTSSSVPKEIWLRPPAGCNQHTTFGIHHLRKAYRKEIEHSLDIIIALHYQDAQTVEVRKENEIVQTTNQCLLNLH